MSDLATARDQYRWFTPITTRWMDNDVYGHINNVTYYSYFDTIANRFLIEQGGFDIQQAEVIGYVVSSQCHYRSAIAFPQNIEGAFRTNRIGNSSVEYGLAIFRNGDNEACAHGSFTHVFVDRQSERPQAIPTSLRSALEGALVTFE